MVRELAQRDRSHCSVFVSLHRNERLSFLLEPSMKSAFLKLKPEVKKLLHTRTIYADTCSAHVCLRCFNRCGSPVLCDRKLLKMYLLLKFYSFAWGSGFCRLLEINV